MSKEYIDREAFKDEYLCCGYLPEMSEDEFDAFPAADVVEVVRCEDCLHSTERYGHMECIHGVSYRNTWNKPDFFCPYGEKRRDKDGTT